VEGGLAVQRKASRFDWLVSLGQALAWLVTAFGVLLTALFLREALLDILGLYGDRRLTSFRDAGVIGKELWINTQIHAADFLVIFIMACLGVWAIVAIDDYFRKGRKKGLLLKRILTVVGIELGVIVGSVLLRVLMGA
jgi:hypothetical protein